MNRLPRLSQPSKPIPSADPTTVKDAAVRRLRILGGLVVATFSLLIGRLWILQVVQSPDLEKAATNQSTRQLVTTAARGSILDVHGQPIVDSRFTQTVSVNVDEMGKENREKVITGLAQALQMTPQEVAERMDNETIASNENRPIASDVPDDVVFWIHANRTHRFPGVHAERQLQRDYPQGTLAAHVVGYTGEISGDQLKQEEYAGYKSGNLIGLAGVERTWESTLRGLDGIRQVKVNVRGDILEDLGVIRQPQRGANVRLTIDSTIQRVTEKALADGIARARRTPDTERGEGRGGTFAATSGAVVVLDPATGAVEAMTSWPTFDPAAFVGGISQSDWELLQDPEMNQPMLNRAIQTAVPPGSVYKPITVATALEQGFAKQDTYIPCPAAWEWNKNVYRNHAKTDSGSLNLAETLEQSCDTVLYEMARNMYNNEANTAQGQAYHEFTLKTPPEGTTGDQVPYPEEYLADMSRAFGLESMSGIDLPGEKAGNVPGRKWRMEYWLKSKKSYCEQADAAEPGTYSRTLFSDLCNHGYRWRGGDLVNMSIGQGDLQVTPLAVADMFAGIANRGTIMTPHVVAQVDLVDGTTKAITPTQKYQLPVSQEHLDYIERGLVLVTEGAKGTAVKAFEGVRTQIAGKTGTAENKPKQPYAWFAGYNTQLINGKQHVVVAMIEEGGGGSAVAAPIVRDIFKALEGQQP
ncbi:penicillin-binding protein 2 [Stomatohabitans albus]|uniref:penicillin-binding protein 2 n=1 Tax=Stomatohabitans albus TaxID=3110766 RepID=UPI00300D64EC